MVEKIPEDPLRVLRFIVDVVIELVFIIFVLIEVVIISPIFKNPKEGPIVSAFTVKDEINAFCELIEVVDIPPPNVANPPIFRAPPSDSEPTVRDVT